MKRHRQDAGRGGEQRYRSAPDELCTDTHCDDVGRDISKASTFRHFRSAPEGSFSDTASIDGVRRLYFFRNFPDLPLIIMVAEAEKDIYAAW
ncbi:hypothetical protein B0G83_12631 [Paraburkholderia sp. BL21I4N1]|nr:hypothetical protein B0G83_12631 [Paraburkholderia sp. BL21I4N1]